MTRILALGNSHIAMLKQGSARLQEQFPDANLEFFSAPGSMFLLGKADENGIFTPRVRSDRDREVVVRINGTDSVDLTKYDEVFVVGHRFFLMVAAELLLEHDILEGTPTGKARYVSDAFFDASAEAHLKETAARIHERLGHTNKITFTIAPYPASSISQRGPEFLFGHTITTLANHPEGPRLFERWVKQVEKALTDFGYRFVHQPDETVDGPSTTKPEFSVDAAAGLTETLSEPDHRHMNADFGFRLLQKYVTETLNLRQAQAV